MTALRDAIDTTTLGWIKPELDETLRQARHEIEAYAETPADTGRMRACAAFLHQVHGTLRMVELYAPAMVAEEMERLARALHDGVAEVTDRDDACAVLMRGVVLLPDYLERLQGGHKDIPIVLLPLLNELRAARGETGLSESVLFSPDLEKPLPDSLPAPTPLPRQSRQMVAAQQLSALREALSTWPEDGAPGNIAALERGHRRPAGQRRPRSHAPHVVGRLVGRQRPARRRAAADPFAAPGVRQRRTRSAEHVRRRRLRRAARRTDARADPPAAVPRRPQRTAARRRSTACARPSTSPCSCRPKPKSRTPAAA